MKNLKTIAKEFNLYQVSDIPERYKNEYFDHRINCGNNLIPDFFKTLKGYESGLFYECKQDTDYKGIITYYIEHSHTLVKKNDSDIILMLKKDNKGKYDFYPYYSLMHKYNVISHDLKRRSLKDIVKPNDIGVFTEKKVNDWFAYCNEYLSILDAALCELNDKNKEIQNSIDSFISSVPGCKVSKYQNTIDVDTDLFRVRFDHYKDQKYLSTKIDFKGTINDIISIEANVLQSN